MKSKSREPRGLDSFQTLRKSTRLSSDHGASDIPVEHAHTVVETELWKVVRVTETEIMETGVTEPEIMEEIPVTESEIMDEIGMAEHEVSEEVVVIDNDLMEGVTEVMEERGVTDKEVVISEENPEPAPRGKFDCEQCERKCRDNEALRRHMKIHRDVPKICQFCEETFSSLHQMLKHKKLCYYKCSQCKKVFKRISKFERHKRMHITECKRWT